MALTLSAKVKVALEWIQQQDTDLSVITDASDLTASYELADGTGDDQADRLWYDTRVLASGANDDLDLSSTTALIRSIFGTNVPTSFARIKAIVIENPTATDSEYLYIDTSVANAFTGWAGNTTSKANVGPESVLVLSDLRNGWAVTAGTADILRIHNAGAGSITYNIAILGTSA